LLRLHVVPVLGGKDFAVTSRRTPSRVRTGVFIGPKGATPLRQNFSSVWARALDGSGLVGIHIHDLRHTGNHFAAMTGASTRELMGRMGHARLDAALIYQHRTADCDRAIADALDVMLVGFGEGSETGLGPGVAGSGRDG